MCSPQKNLRTWATRRRFIPSLLRWNSFGRELREMNVVPALDGSQSLPYNYRFPNSTFRGSCDSSPSSCHLLCGPRDWPQPRPAERPVLVFISFPHKRLEAAGHSGIDVFALLALLLVAAPVVGQQDLIVGITIHGNRRIPADTVKARIFTQGRRRLRRRPPSNVTSTRSGIRATLKTSALNANRAPRAGSSTSTSKSGPPSARSITPG